MALAYPLSTYKVAHHYERVRDFRDGKLTYPISLLMHPVAACNHRCTFCRYQSFPESVFNGNLDLSGSISLCKMEEIVDDCVAMDVRSIEVSGGGEPVLHKDFVSIADKIIESKLDLGLVTNGVGGWWRKDTPRVVDSLADKAVWVRFSVNGGDAATYGDVHRTRADDFGIALESVGALCKRKGATTVGMSFVVMPENLDGMYDAARFAEDLGADYIRFGSMLPIEHHCENQRADYYTVPVYERILTMLDKISDSVSVSVYEDFRDRSDFAESYGMYESDDLCYYGDFTAYLGADLNVYPCCVWVYHPDYVLGSLADCSFKEFWDGDARAKFWSGFNISEVCGSCYLKPKNDLLKYLITNQAHANFI